MRKVLGGRWHRHGPGDKAALLLLAAITIGCVGVVYHRHSIGAGFLATIAAFTALGIGMIIGRVRAGGPTA